MTLTIDITTSMQKVHPKTLLNEEGNIRSH